jgi:hypothetical protein
MDTLVILHKGKYHSKPRILTPQMPSSHNGRTNK